MFTIVYVSYVVRKIIIKNDTPLGVPLSNILLNNLTIVVKEQYCELFRFYYSKGCPQDVAPLGFYNPLFEMLF